jgi:ligand-binding sensor domain-containing protein
MRKIFFILLPFLGLHCLSSTAAAQSRRLKFETINEEQNLSHNSVTGIVQDDQGFIWISTIDGLNRFDGYSCKVYKYIPGDSTSISGNRTGGIYFDSRGYLWIGAYGFGLNRFNPKTEKFKHYIHDDSDSNSISSDYISGIIEESD